MPALWMIVASLLFALMGVCVKLGAEHFSTAELTFVRGMAGVMLMTALMAARGTAWRTPHWRLQLSRAVAGSLALACYFFAIGILPLATAVTLNYTSPLFVALLLALWFGERLHRRAIIAVMLGFLGVVLLLRPTLVADQWHGALAGLGTGMIASLAYIHVRELGRAGEPEARTVFYFSLVTTLGALPFVLLGDGFHASDAEGAAMLVGVGLFGTGAQLAMTRAYRFGATLVVANLAYTTVVFASLFGVLWWDELLYTPALVGMSMIVVSGVLISLTRGATPYPR